MRCEFCFLKAHYIVQWGADPKDKRSACKDHIRDPLDDVKSPEMWVVKVQKA